MSEGDKPVVGGINFGPREDGIWFGTPSEGSIDTGEIHRAPLVREIERLTAERDLERSMRVHSEKNVLSLMDEVDRLRRRLRDIEEDYARSINSAGDDLRGQIADTLAAEAEVKRLRRALYRIASHTEGWTRENGQQRWTQPHEVAAVALAEEPAAPSQGVR